MDFFCISWTIPWYGLKLGIMSEQGNNSDTSIAIQKKIKAGFIGQRMFVIPRHIFARIKKN